MLPLLMWRKLVAEALQLSNIYFSWWLLPCALLATWFRASQAACSSQWNTYKLL